MEFAGVSLAIVPYYLGFASHFVGAVLCAAALLWIARFQKNRRPDHRALMLAAALSALWCTLVAALGPYSAWSLGAASARNLAYFFLIFRLFAADGRDESLRPIRPVIITLALVELLQPVLLLIDSQVGVVPELAALIREVSMLLAMLIAVGALVLVHNLYAGAANASRSALRLGTAAMAGIFAYDLNLATLAYLQGDAPAILVAMRGAVGGGLIALMALGAGGKGASLSFRPSRAVTFQTLSLLVIGTYFLLMVLVTRMLALIGGDAARTSQVLFLVGAAVLALVWLPSRRMRAWLRVTVMKHLFQHRYDYREEWLRFNRTVSRQQDNGASFHERAVQALADIADSPAGLLLARAEEGHLDLAARWNWPMIEVPARPVSFALGQVMEQHNHILDLDEVREGINHHGEAETVATWLLEARDAWAVVPLIHFDKLVGAIVLARPRVTRQLDWEDFDLLRVVGQQLASYLAEQASQQALMEQSRFDEFNRRMAFVMHDIKNLASQIALLSTNAQKHAENPDFRADMLLTLRNSSDKLNALLARLGRYGTSDAANAQPVDLLLTAQKLVKRFAPSHPVLLGEDRKAVVLADPDRLEQALGHLIQNAIEASDDKAAVLLNVTNDGLNGAIEVLDTGSGMTPEFIRTGLFKPFVSSKQSGFGIGAFEARELVKAMGGQLRVESREGVGSRFVASFPIPETARLLEGLEPAAASRSRADIPEEAA